MVSFSLQVFLLMSAPFRRRHCSRLLNGSLWVAYQMADYVTTYVLGRLTLLLAVAGGNGNDATPQRHKLPLFWAPFLLLHLGGQETITAFSMEDNTLWKRRLLDLVTQVAMSVYVVGKQWHGDRLLVAPMVLVFMLGIVKYGERIWALRAAAALAPESSSFDSLVAHSYKNLDQDISVRGSRDHYKRLLYISSQDKISTESILMEASVDFQASLDFFMDMTPSTPNSSHWRFAHRLLRDVSLQLKSSKNVHGMAYKLAEMQVSLIYDYLYTKFGTIRFQASPSLAEFDSIMVAVLQWLVSLGLTSVALVLFARAMAGNTNYSGSDVLITYILLVGAISMEIASIFIALTSTWWACIIVAKHLHRLHIGEWPGKLAQFKMVDACAQERERRQQTSPGGAVGALIRWILPAPYETRPPHIVVSPEVKKLLLNKLLEMVIDVEKFRWDFSRFRGCWALWVANRVDSGLAAADPAHRALSASGIQELNFVSNVIVWHLVTTICLMVPGGPDNLKNPCNDLSSYIMYLVAKRGVMVDSSGHFVIARSQGEMPDFLDDLHQDGFIQKILQGDQPFFDSLKTSSRSKAFKACKELFKIPEARDRWELIAAVWMEILCYMAFNCGATFHAKHLATGGEFLTQVKMLLFILRFPFFNQQV
uniref:DUF4220 domain-containing protein n=1 Tax=Oryza nivara TaxID=4536 RepID=A0A0E0J486_ORYNI